MHIPKKRCTFARLLTETKANPIRNNTLPNIKPTLKYIVLLALVLLPVGLRAGVTRVAGSVVDANSGETLPFVQIVFTGTTIGTTSDLNGNFTIQNEQGLTTLEFRMVGYKTKTLTVKPNRETELFVPLQPEVYALEDVVVKPKKKREHYRRKGNPAVELIQNVIAQKDKNRFGSGATYRKESYEKLVMAVEPFDYNLNKNKFWREFRFLENFVDTMHLEDGVLRIDSGKVQIDTLRIGEDTTIIRIDSTVLRRDEQQAKAIETPILTISIREQLADEYTQFNPTKERKVVKAKRWNGLDQLLDNGGISQNIQAIFQPVNIFANDINIMLNRFVSPLSSSLAVSFYHYYIMDTLLIEGEPCIDLAFVPVNSESFGFTGHLYIVADSTYALKRYHINIPPKSNVNWLTHMSISETFQRLPNGKWASEEVNTHARFGITKKSKHNIYARQTRHFSKYTLNTPIPDSLFYMAGNEVMLAGADRIPGRDWDTIRPRPLAYKETIVDSLETELMKVRSFRTIVHTVQDLIQEFIPTTAKRDSSRWDFGPIFNTISYNEQEGVRLRIGGMTTANQNPRWFTSEYIAYGFDDKRVKGGINIVHSFHNKKYHPYESLRHNLSFHLSYDLEELGQTYRVIDRDHILMSVKFSYKPKPMQYVAKVRLRYEKEWANQLSVITFVDAMNNQPNGSLGIIRGKDTLWQAPRYGRSPLLLQYNKRLADGSYIERPFYHEVLWTTQLRYSPGGFIYNDRQGIESPFNLWKDAPVFRLTNELGYIFEDRYWYDRIQVSAEKRFWLSAFGHLDITVDAGYIAGKKVPYTRLFVPVSNQSILMDPKSFSLMQPAEFMMDRYASLHMTYYMKGWLFNRIPGLKLLKLREVVSFHMLAGYLGDRNNPDLTDGLYDLPYSYSTEDKFYKCRTNFQDGLREDGTYKYGYMPYMEITAGIENIFKILRIEYVRRLTHLNAPDGTKLGPWQRNGIRITLRAAI